MTLSQVAQALARGVRGGRIHRIAPLLLGGLAVSLLPGFAGSAVLQGHPAGSRAFSKATTASDTVVTATGRITLLGNASVRVNGMDVNADKIVLVDSLGSRDVRWPGADIIVAEGAAVVRLNAAARKALGSKAVFSGDQILTSDDDTVIIQGQRVTVDASAGSSGR